jgi:AraC-like DNA-binding protein
LRGTGPLQLNALAPLRQSDRVRTSSEMQPVRRVVGRIPDAFSHIGLLRHGAAALSRSSFCERFTRTVGVAPMEYLVSWRMVIAKDLLSRDELTVAEVAERVGYGSTSAFSVAFSRHVGQSPSRYA